MENTSDRLFHIRKAQGEMHENPRVLKEGDLVRIKNEEGMPPDVRPETRRVLLVVRGEDSGSKKVWVGPVTMSSREVEDFKEEWLTNIPHQQKYAGCFLVDVSRLIKLADA